MFPTFIGIDQATNHSTYWPWFSVKAFKHFGATAPILWIWHTLILFNSLRLNCPFFAFKIYSKWLYLLKNKLKASCSQTNWVLMNFDSKRCPFSKTQWYSHKLHNDWHFTTFEVKDSCNSTPKSYMCSVLSVDCWKFQKINKKMEL